MLCLPVVQGGIERNSSKVRTRGLQHFQPDQNVSIVVGKLIEDGEADLPFWPSWNSGGPKLLVSDLSYYNNVVLY